jgi:hypothetical protein
MKDQDYEQLSQYLDGELDQFASRRLEQRLAAEPELQSLLAQLQAQDNAIKTAFNGTEQAPQHVAALLESNVVTFPRQQDRRPTWQYAIAASLVAAVGLVLTPSWQQAPQGDPVLASVLEQTPSMASGWKTLDDGRQVRPVLSFKDNDGSWCREYLLSSGEQGSRGVACRQGSNWNTLVFAEATLPGNAIDFRPASAGDTDIIADYMADNAATIALSADEEAKLIASDWE